MFGAVVSGSALASLRTLRLASAPDSSAMTRMQASDSLVHSWPRQTMSVSLNGIRPSFAVVRTSSFSFIGALGEIAAPGGYVAGGPPVVIIDLNMHFIGTAKAGQWIEMVGTINRKTRSLVFAEGRGTADGQLVFTATAIHKIVGG